MTTTRPCLWFQSTWCLTTVLQPRAAHQDIRGLLHAADFWIHMWSYWCESYLRPSVCRSPRPPCPPPVPCSPWSRWRRVVLQMPQSLQLTPFDVEGLWLCSELLPVPHPVSKTEPQARSTRTCWGQSSTGFNFDHWVLWRTFVWPIETNHTAALSSSTRWGSVNSFGGSVVVTTHSSPGRIATQLSSFWVSDAWFY